ncbi:MAG: DUF4197 domain-containing protein [Burkholderiaceae bacterium]|nr:MAG: DUF4197 domain-containing protein [Burkholderiaceae bacterium]
MTMLIIGWAGLFFALPAGADVSWLSQTDATSGLKAALQKGSTAAVSKLGVTDGFFGNPKVKLPLPDSLQKIEKGLKFLGMQKQADELVLAMNRAAEAAVPEAKTLLIDAVKQMRVADAKKILSGGDDAVTQYFKEKTQSPLAQKFLPIVKKATAQVGLAQKYNALAGKGVQLGLVKEDQSTVERYVTAKALDGLYLMIAEEERAIRSDPVGTGSAILQKVFGALKQ